MFRDELEAALEACPVVSFAYGLCEAHGPQNAIGESRCRVSPFRPMRPLVTSRPATHLPGAHRPSPARLAYQQLCRLVVPPFSAAATADAA